MAKQREGPEAEGLESAAPGLSFAEIMSHEAAGRQVNHGEFVRFITSALPEPDDPEPLDSSGQMKAVHV